MLAFTWAWTRRNKAGGAFRSLPFDYQDHEGTGFRPGAGSLAVRCGYRLHLRGGQEQLLGFRIESHGLGAAVVTGGGGAPLYNVDKPAEGITAKVAKTENFVTVKVDGKSAHIEAIVLDGTKLDEIDLHGETQ